VQSKLGIVPNLTRVLANAPAALEGYLNFSGALSGGTLSAKVREQIALAVAQGNKCGYCLSAHTFIGGKAGLADSEITSARMGNGAAGKDDAILKLALTILAQQGEISDTALKSARTAGLSDAEIVETTANVALNIYTNYINHVAQTSPQNKQVKLNKVKQLVMKTEKPTSAYPKTTYHKVAVDGLEIFYREAGSPKKPTVLLMHGFPTSSHMFRELIPALASDYHVIAPDYPGFGQSSAPDVTKFTYTFDHLADVMEHFLKQIGCTRFALFMQDYGSPVGFRIAVKHPEWVSALLIQNANAYLEGINMETFKPLQPFWANRTAETEAPVRGFLAAGTTQFQYTHGTRNPASISPDNWLHDQALLDRPGNDLIQLALLHDYQNNPPLYPSWHSYLRNHQPPTLITWGKNDPFFTESGARAYLKDVPKAELHLLNTGHFALEEDGDIIAAYILEFLDTNLK
jgi:uncharacterized peroxidase-related enzyme